MIDAFVLLTPILLFAIVALLGFVGCDRVFGLAQVDPPTETPVTHVQTVVKSAPAGTSNITADPLTLKGGELIIVTLQWRSGIAQQPTPLLTGGNFAPVAGGGPFDWNSMKVQSFFAFNAQGSTSVIVEAVLMGGSNIQWNLCVSAYDGADLHNPLYSPQQSGPAFLGTNPQAPPINVGVGDLIYAVALAADNNGTFPGNNALTSGPGFTTEFPTSSNPLVEDGGVGNPVIASAINTTANPNPRGFIFAMGIKASSG